MKKNVAKKEKGFRKKFTDGEIAWVKDKYLQQVPTTQIAKEFLSISGGKTISEAIIRKWAKDNEWPIAVGTALVVANQDIQKAGKSIVEMTEAHIAAYDEIENVGKSKVDTSLRSGLEAAQMVDMAIKGKRQILTGLVAVQLVGDLIDILENRVSDPAVRADIIRDLRELSVKYQNLGM